jgi:hypothetical protein
MPMGKFCEYLYYLVDFCILWGAFMGENRGAVFILFGGERGHFVFIVGFLFFFGDFYFIHFLVVSRIEIILKI